MSAPDLDRVRDLEQAARDAQAALDAALRAAHADGHSVRQIASVTVMSRGAIARRIAQGDDDGASQAQRRH